MKKIAVIISLVFLVTLGCTTTRQSDSREEPALRTAYNIWKLKDYNMKCINYKYGRNFIPAGTSVRDVRIVTDEETLMEKIRFRTVDECRTYGIYFVPKWHPGKTIKDYKDYMFTPKPFDELTRGMSDAEIDAIKNGVLVKGMSKQALLVCYGPPPEHATASLDDSVWTYWKNKFGRIRIWFDEDNRISKYRGAPLSNPR
ncbi:MAG: hypothetical protein IMF11_08895 [Proteobacteria bacterium]|nr:hypothetical protein [Pseudomonadota bacterium]